MPDVRDYRRGLRRIYREHEALARSTQLNRVKKIVDVVRAGDPTVRTLPRFRKAITNSGDAATARHTKQFARMFDDVASETSSYLARQASRALGQDVALNTKTIAAASKRLRTGKIAGATLTQRIHDLSADGTEKARLRVLSGALRKEAGVAVAGDIEKLSLGASKKAGAMYRAERLARSEQTRYTAHLTVELSRQLEKAHGLIAIYTLRTQGDDRVRDEHDALNGVEFVDEDFVGFVNYSPVTEALGALSQPSCRCWLEVQYMRLD